MDSNAKPTRKEKSATRQRRVRRQKRITLGLLFLILVLSAFGMTGFVLANKLTAQQVDAQYKTVDQQRFLKTRVTKKTAQAIEAKKEHWSWLLRAKVVKDMATFTSDYESRQTRDRAVAALRDGQYYRDTVTDQKLTALDQTLLKEKNQTVYQQQKNRLDTVQVWYAQTTDGDKFINETYQLFQSNRDELTQEKVSEANVYYRLLKNHKIKAKWQKPIQEMTAGYSALEKEKQDSQAQSDQAALDNLKNASLTQDYTPAKVTITDGRSSSSQRNNAQTTDSDSLTDSLTALGITANRVLVLDTTTGMLYMAQRTSGQYIVSGSRYTMLNNGLTTGAYQVQALIQNPSSQAGVITSGQGFGTYFTTPSAEYEADTNTTTDFNEAQPIFWLRNQPALDPAILVTSDQSIGFITSGNLSGQNLTRVSTTTLNNLMNVVNTTTTIGVI